MTTKNDADGTPQRVFPNGYDLGYSATMHMEAHAGDAGDAYTILIEATPGSTDIDFFYMKNSSGKTLRIYKIKARSASGDVEIQIKTGVTGTPAGGTAITPVNALVGSGNLAEGTFEQRSGDLALTGGNVFDLLFIDSATADEKVYNYSGEIALLKNQAAVFNAVTNPGGAINMTVYCYYHEPIE